ECVHGPAGDAVVEHGPNRCHAGGFVRKWFDFGRRKEVCRWSSDGKEHQVDADTGGEQHRCPRKQSIFGARMIWAESGIAYSAEGNHDDEKNNDPRCEDVVPAKVFSNPIHGTENDCFCLSWSDPGPENKRDNQTSSCEKYRLIDS